MQKLILLTALCVLGATHTAYAAITSPSTCAYGDCGATNTPILGCNIEGYLGTKICYRNGSSDVYVQSCNNCPDGMTRTSLSIALNGCNASYFGCTGCPSVCSSTSWTASSTGYETRCYNNGCQYRCAAGYYGSATGNAYGTTSPTGCTQCPSSGGVAGQSVAGDNTAITKCYIPAGTSFSDSTGSGTYTNNCYWTN